MRAGAFDYDLFRGGLAGSDPNDWFLRSTFVVGPPTEPIGAARPPLVPRDLPTEPPPEPLPPGVYPIIGPELATYGVVQPIARQLGMTTLGTLQDRIGDTSLVANTAMPVRRRHAEHDRDQGAGEGAARLPVGRLGALGLGPIPRPADRQPLQGLRRSARLRQLLGFQSGIDLWRGESLPGHRDVAGFYVAYANADVGVNGLVTNEAATAYVLRKTGNLNLDAWSGCGLLDASRPNRLVSRRSGAGDAL